MAHVSISFKKSWPNYVRGFDDWVVLESWEIEDPYSRRRCGLQGCKRLIGHPEREVNPALHADYDPTKEQPGTFSQWPVKPSSWGLPEGMRASRGSVVNSEGAIRGTPWRT